MPRFETSFYIVHGDIYSFVFQFFVSINYSFDMRDIFRDNLIFERKKKKKKEMINCSYFFFFYFAKIFVAFENL